MWPSPWKLIIKNTCRAYSRNLGKVRCWPERALFYKKGISLWKKSAFFIKRAPKIYLPPLPYSIPFLSVFHQNKNLHNFLKRGQRSIVEISMGLEYALRWPFFSKLSVHFEPLLGLEYACVCHDLRLKKEGIYVKKREYERSKWHRWHLSWKVCLKSAVLAKYDDVYSH